MRRQAQDQIPIFRFESLSDNGRLQQAIFTRQGGTSPGPYDTLNLSLSVPDAKANVFANRAKAYGTHGRSNDSLVHAHLVHGSETALVTSQDYGTYVGPVDALLTNEPGCGLTMNFADCAPVMLYDPVHKAIGLGHAGWQGAVKDLPGSMVRAMQRAYGSDPAGLLAGIGPCIGPCCYEVGEPVISAVRDSFAQGQTLLVTPAEGRQTANGAGRPHFDLPEANRRRLAAAGVRHIEPSGLCTACRTDLFYSHRAEKGRTGRFGTILVLNQG
jgi:YfiH family protein